MTGSGLLFYDAVPAALRRELHAWALAEMRREPGSALGVMRGNAWAGRKTGPEDSPAPVLELARIAQAIALPDTVLRWEAWPVILEEGGSIGWHDHHQARIAAVVYLEVGTWAGPLLFEGGEVRPEAGDLLVMDGTVRHAVGPGAGRRVSVAVNFYDRGP